jgi:peptide-methionine (S)-S-oxide reductase
MVDTWRTALLSLILGCAGGDMTSRDTTTPSLGGIRPTLFRTRHAPARAERIEVATFAAGCFWGVEEEFRKTKGVLATAVGYTGGHTKSPTYHQVCDGNTGHAEAVRVEFDPRVVSYDQLLELFWSIHDPTTVDRQGPDVGDQYRSAIFFHSPDQERAAIASRDRLAGSGDLRDPVVTQIVPAVDFTPAEEYHQQYVEKGGAAACHRRRPRPL